MLKRKPIKSDDYYWKGKSNYGGKDYYDIDTQSFTFDKDIPVNKVDDDNLYWLDEEEIQYEDVS